MIASTVIAVEAITVEAIISCVDGGGDQSKIAVEMIAVEAITVKAIAVEAIISCVDPAGG